MRRPIPSEVEKLIKQMTPTEKVSLLAGRARKDEPSSHVLPGLDDRHIPALRLTDGTAGVHASTSASTCYPSPMNLAASFDLVTARALGESLAKECRGAGIHMLRCPSLNLYRSPRGGRNFELMGEDPELVGQLGAALIAGIQRLEVAVAVNQFVGAEQEYDRYGVSADIEERTLREVYLRPFERAVKDAKAACVTVARNPVTGRAATESNELITRILRGDWAFDGLVLSEANALRSTVAPINAGIDIEMPSRRWFTEEAITEAIQTGRIAPDAIDVMVAHRLMVAHRFGWLGKNAKTPGPLVSARNREAESVALETARRGQVLLKNDGLLPFPAERGKRITVLGWQAGNPVISGGGAPSRPPHEVVTLLDALHKEYGFGTRVMYVPMVEPWRGPEAWSNCAFIAKDGGEGLNAEYFDNSRLSGRPKVVRVDRRVDFAWGSDPPVPEVADTPYSVRWRGVFKVTKEDSYDFYIESLDGVADVRVYGEHIFDAVRGLARQQRKLAAGRHKVEVIYRRRQGGDSACHFGFEESKAAYSSYQAGLSSAKESDLVVVAAGFTAATEREGCDRPWDMDPRVEKMILDVAKLAKGKTAVVLYSGGAVSTERWLDKVSALLAIWYPGQNGTLAAAEIFSGKTAPSGALPFTWEKKPEDRGSYPYYLDEKEEGRIEYGDGVFVGHRHFDRNDIEPLFPFGHGLTYTKFLYEYLRTKGFARDGSLKVEVRVTNTGKRAGIALVLFFVGDVEASVPRPVRELKAFRRVLLEPNQHKYVEVTLRPEDFAFFDPVTRLWTIEEGMFLIEAGPTAIDLPTCIEVENLAGGKCV